MGGLRMYNIKQKYIILARKIPHGIPLCGYMQNQ